MKKTAYSISEHNLIYALLMASAGMMGVYTFLLRGGVFCNAQTANVVLMALELGQGHWKEGLYFLIPISAYLAGALLSEILTLNLKKTSLFKWSTYLVGFEILLMIGIAFIPSKPETHHVVQVMINFIASMQFTAFRKAEGIPMATTFCTNHIRQIGIAIATSIHEKDASRLKRGGVHFMMIVFFLVGGLILSLAENAMQELSILLTLIPLIIVFIMLIYGDILSKRSEQVADSCIYADTSSNDNSVVSTIETPNDDDKANEVSCDNITTSTDSSDIDSKDNSNDIK